MTFGMTEPLIQDCLLDGGTSFERLKSVSAATLDDLLESRRSGNFPQTNFFHQNLKLGVVPGELFKTPEGRRVFKRKFSSITQCSNCRKQVHILRNIQKVRRSWLT